MDRTASKPAESCSRLLASGQLRRAPEAATPGEGSKSLLHKSRIDISLQWSRVVKPALVGAGAKGFGY